MESPLMHINIAESPSSSKQSNVLPNFTHLETETMYSVRHRLKKSINQSTHILYNSASQLMPNTLQQLKYAQMERKLNIPIQDIELAKNNKHGKNAFVKV